MKAKFYTAGFLITLIIFANEIEAQNANTSLSNLVSPTAVNVSLLPKNNNHNLGSLNKPWKDLYLDSNIYIGGTKFISTPVNNNIAIGFNALKKIGKSNTNIAIGANALSLNTSGYSNIAIGKAALKNNTTGTSMIAIGDSALFNQSTNQYEAYNNVAIGSKALYSNTSGWDNIGIGPFSLYYNTTGLGNIAMGYANLYYNTTGSGNTAIGNDNLASNTTGTSNAAVGDETLVSNQTGSFNAALGYSALGNNITGSTNVAMGSGAMGFNLNGNSNVAIGAETLIYSNQSNLVAIGDSALFWNGFNVAAGAGVVAVGSKALYNNLSGSSNSAFGSQALYLNTTGINNTAVGYHAGNAVTTGSSNTIIGYGADINDGTFSNATAIGNLAVSGASNRVRIGNGSVTSIGGAVGWTNFSDERIKTNIKQDVPGLAFINLLKPVTYNFDLSKEEQIFKRKNTVEWKEKYDIQKVKFTGFLAQQVEAAAKKINYDFSGVDKPANDKDVYGLRYSDFVMPLVKAVQELSKQNDSLKNEKVLQQKINADLEQRIAKLEAMMNTSSVSSTNSVQSTLISSATLSQNIPNPFSNSTTISYSIQQQFSSAKIIVTDKSGNTLKIITLSNNKGTVKIDAATLSAGAYQYSLYVDRRLIDTKQMLIMK